MESKYSVYHYMDNTYEVIETIEGFGHSVFQGGLADCEAYIRLHEGGYM